MNKYELLFIINNEIDDEAKAQTVEKFKSLIESLGGAVSTVDKWGTRKYAYPIDYKTEGYYTLINFEAESTVPMEVERQMKNTDSVVRSMITRK
jgi:small subunit ribosomal protein S6